MQPRHLVPSFIATLALASTGLGCGGNSPEPIHANPPGPDGAPGIGDGAGPPPDASGIEDATDSGGAGNGADGETSDGDTSGDEPAPER
ncbi:MAG: hypothetical protein KC731_20880 [Myxococcales bacterium]|nr:hypothetical protein [Myxococcales bacterium]